MSSSPASGELAVVERVKRRRSLRGDIFFAFAVGLALYFAWLVRDVLLLVYVSALFAVVLIPVVNGIRKLRIGKWQPGRGVAILILFLGFAGFVALFAVFAIPPVIGDLRQFAGELPTRGPQLLLRIQRLPLLQHANLSALNAKLQDFASNFVTYVLLSIRNWASKLFDVVTGIVLTVYFMLEGDHAYAWVLSLIPERKRERLNRTLGRAEIRMGKWLLGQGLLMIILGVASTIVFVSLKVRYAYALGVLMGLFNLIPIVGAMITVSLALMVAAIDSWGRVLGVLIFYVIYAQVETSYLTPRIMKTSVDLAGLAVIIALLLGASLAGVMGAMVSVPTAVLVAVLIDEYMIKAPVIKPESAELEDVSI